MKVSFDESFEKSIKSLKDKKIKERLIDLIITFEEADTLSAIAHVKKLQGFKNFYRVRLGDYRVGFEVLSDASILFIIVANRKDIYRVFP